MSTAKWVGRVDRLLAGLPVFPRSLPQSRSAIAGSPAMVAVLAAYLILEWVSDIHEYKGVPITPWNPGLGLVLAFMVLGGLRYAAVLFVGAVIAEIAVLHSELAWPVILGIAAIMATGYGIVAKLVRDNLRLDTGFNRLRDVVLLLVSGVAGAVLVAALISLLLVADQLDFADVLVAAGPLLIGDVIGIAVITPLTLRLALHPRPLFERASLPMLAELSGLVAIVVAGLWLMLAAAGPDASKLFYVLFLPVGIVAVRYGLDGACLGLAATQLSLVGLLHHYGYDATAFAEFQLLMLVLSATGLTVGVVVTERQHADRTVREVELKLKAKEAEAAQAARFHLVSGAAAALAHEINQPMTAARALARSVQQILRGSDIDRPRMDSNLKDLIAQVDHVAAVVRHVRDFLRRGGPQFSAVDVRDLLEDALVLPRPDLSANGIVVELDAPDGLLVHGDAVQLQEVILNLVRNAADSIVEARIPGGRIDVTARRLEAPRRIEIAVADNGPGISPDMAERLFQPLTTSKADGLGLGLSISASIVEVHGGRIWLHSGRPGACEFRFSLPCETG